MSTIGKVTWATVAVIVGGGAVAASVHGAVVGNVPESATGGAALATLVLIYLRRFG